MTSRCGVWTMQGKQQRIAGAFSRSRSWKGKGDERKNDTKVKAPGEDVDPARSVGCARHESGCFAVDETTSPRSNAEGRGRGKEEQEGEGEGEEKRRGGGRWNGIRAVGILGRNGSLEDRNLRSMLGRSIVVRFY